MTENNNDKIILSWQFPEYIQYERGRSWYVVIIIFLAVLVIYSIITVNLLFALFLILFGLVLILQVRRSPAKVEFKIGEQGITVGEKFYEWDDINNFRLVYKPPETKRLYIDLKNTFFADFSVPLEEQKVDKVREVLNNYLTEDLEKKEETLIDRLGRWMKI
ncbi:hypothetical protein IID20_01225 [Patescibacteria group bacterium]|nr:hypothetical protein [Patescibacteria group bacterium]